MAEKIKLLTFPSLPKPDAIQLPFKPSALLVEICRFKSETSGNDYFGIVSCEGKLFVKKTDPLRMTRDADKAARWKDFDSALIAAMANFQHIKEQYNEM